MSTKKAKPVDLSSLSESDLNRKWEFNDSNGNNAICDMKQINPVALKVTVVFSGNLTMGQIIVPKQGELFGSYTRGKREPLSNFVLLRKSGLKEIEDALNNLK